MTRKGLYLVLFAAFVALVSFARWDLVENAARMTAAQFAKGGTNRIKLIFEIVLFAGILALTARAITARMDPRRDAALVALGLLAGWCAEAWGTRLYLWRYYTGETPPLWIVPAWPLGVLVIDRMAEHAKGAVTDRIPPAALTAGYWCLFAGSAAVFLFFSQPVLARPTTWMMGAALAAAFLFKPDPKQAVPFLLTGLVCVFFADLWGTTNHCWRYYIQHPGVRCGLGIGILFGMTFDTATVFLCWRLGNFLVGPPLGPGGPKDLEGT